MISTFAISKDTAWLSSVKLVSSSAALEVKRSLVSQMELISQMLVTF